MIVDDQNTHRRCPKSQVDLGCCIASDDRATPTSAPSLPSRRIVHLGRKCCTVQLDSRPYCLSTLPVIRSLRRPPIWTSAMWQKLSLRARLNVLLALILTLGLVINVGRLVREA